jgi:hypothetical protein
MTFAHLLHLYIPTRGYFLVLSVDNPAYLDTIPKIVASLRMETLEEERIKVANWNGLFWREVSNNANQIHG